MRRNVKLAASVFCVIVVLALFVSTAVADGSFFYAGTELSVSYGARGISAYIHTPASRPVIYGDNPNGQAHWVSIVDTAWIQSGWDLYPADTGAKKYIEYLTTSGEYWLNPAYEYGSQSWDTGVEYEVNYTPDNQWCAAIGAYVLKCKDIGLAPPVKIGAKSEVYGDSHTQIYTVFDNILYKQSNEVWTAIHDNYFVRDFPYDNFKFSDSHFFTYRPTTHETYLPSVMK
jgi:hypothetical protein